MTGAKLPDGVGKFDGLGHLEKSSGFAEKMLLLTLSACVFCFLTVISTRDSALITDASSLVLPARPSGQNALGHLRKGGAVPAR